MILPYQLDATNDLLMSRAGLITIAQIMKTLGLAEHIDQYLPLSMSNCEGGCNHKLKILG